MRFSSTSAAPAETRGFTLVELLVSMALLTILGTLVVRLFDASLDLWQEGEETRDLLEMKAAVKSTLERDFNSLVAGDGRLVYADDGTGEIGFVRSLAVGEQQRLLDDLRWRGGLAGSLLERITKAEEAYEEARRAYEQGKSPPGAEPPSFSWYDLVPARGEAWITYVVATDPLADDPSIVALYRAAVPVGAGDPARRAELLQSLAGGIGTEEAGIFRKVAGSLLHVEWTFRTEWTHDWDSAGVSFDDWLESYRAFGQSQARRPTGAMTLPVLGWSSGLEDSDPRNDVYPEAVRLRIVLVSEEERRRPWRLVNELAATEGAADPRGARTLEIPIGGATREIPVDATHAKVGGEWMAISAVRGRRVTVAGRGLRGTTARDHESGSRIWFGRELELFVRLPAAGGGVLR